MSAKKPSQEASAARPETKKTAGQPIRAVRPAPSRRPLHGLWPLLRYQFRHTVLYPSNLGFALLLPVIMYFMFGAFQSYSSIWRGHSNVSAQVMFSMGAYGATMAAASIAAGVGIERASGWSRQLALTPTTSATYLANKILLALASALLSLLGLMAVGFFCGAKAEGPMWVAVPGLILFGSLVTANMGLALGYLFRSDAAYAIIGGGSAIFAFLAGVWMPLDNMPEFFRDFAPYTPMYGLFHFSQWPLKDSPFNWAWIVNIAAWTAFFAAIAIRRIRKDTAR